ncbi:hypothetical protein [Bacteroides cellulosilyticus]|uniref:hypothetical protein n=1 Tax=Bacteroides cellulosilyticus TaxID=246787 RepID=UPI001F243DAB|nr:hypothetical protein [Bacteroides cellulosilyticus]
MCVIVQLIVGVLDTDQRLFNSFGSDVAFNIWCGMRADGVSIVRCQNFKWSKFKNALAELLLYLVIIEVVFVHGFNRGWR